MDSNTPTELTEKWFADNPISVYLEVSEVVKDSFSRTIGVSITTLRHWRRGRYPSEENRDNLAKAMGISIQEFELQWSEWESEKPFIPAKVREC